MSRLENMGFTVLALCCDGLAANRSLPRLHDVGSKIPVNKVVNPYAHDGTKRNLFFISDPPHLMKTVRNCWANPKRRLWVSAISFVVMTAKHVCFSTTLVQWNGGLLEAS